MKEKIKAFALGVMEFRQQMTTHYEYPLIESYDSGREMAHKLMFRFYEN